MSVLLPITRTFLRLNNCWGVSIVTTLETLEHLKREAFSGSLAKASRSELEEYSAALCHSQAFAAFGSHEFPQVCETVRIHLLRAHIESLQSHVVRLHDHITKLNTKNAITQYCVIALTVAAVIAASIQTTVAIRAERRAEAQDMQSAKALPAQQPPASAPTPATPPATHPASSKAVGAKAAKANPGSSPHPQPVVPRDAAR